MHRDSRVSQSQPLSSCLSVNRPVRRYIRYERTSTLEIWRAVPKTERTRPLPSGASPTVHNGSVGSRVAP